MSIEENKELIRRYIEVGNSIQGDTSKVRTMAEEFLAPGFISHHSLAGDMKPEQWITSYEALFSAFPDMQYTIVDMIAEGDRVAVQYVSKATHRGIFQGIPPTEKQIIVTGVGIYRIAQGRFTEIWAFVDTFSMMQQLGIIPSK
jgi:steroid delta-isomerase-like uncharacterized protein